MAQEWLYKATDSKASLIDTEKLAIHDGFLAKAAYEDSDRKTRADQVKRVECGDVIHFYFKKLSDPASVVSVIGSFEVTNQLPNSVQCSWPTEETHLVTVLDSGFVNRLKSLGYADDPQLGVTTGWALKKLDVPPPTYDPDSFPSQHCFVRR